MTSALESVMNLVLPLVEVEVKKQIELHSDQLVEQLVAALVKAIPGQIDDALAASVMPMLKLEAKKLLLGQAEKIS